ncbi:MAG: hypothetical protein M5U28_35465 [Sandaracinaceae bacterium]|nr:hypothetical protein [Sandaracinaceae bacterium]
MSRALPGACMLPKNSTFFSSISFGTVAPHAPQNLCPAGTGVEHSLQT